MSEQQQKSRDTIEVETEEPAEPIERPGEPTPEENDQNESKPNGQSSLLNGHFNGDPRRHQNTNSGDGKLDPFSIPDTTNLRTLEMSKSELDEAMKQPWKVADEYINKNDNVDEKGAIFSGEISYSRLNVLADHVTGVVTESRLAVTEEGWYIAVVDSANVGMVYAWLPASSWDRYDCKQVGTTGLSWTKIQNALKHANTDAQIQIDLDDPRDEDADIESYDQSDFTINDGIPFEFSGISAASCRSAPELPEVELPDTFVLPGVDVRELFNRMDDITDHVEIRGNADNNSVKLFGEGDTSSIYKEYAKFDDLTVYDGSRKNNVFENEIVEDATSLFSLDYLLDYFKSPKEVDQRVGYRFRLGDEVPLKITRDLGDEGFIQFVLAPRVKSD